MPVPGLRLRFRHPTYYHYDVLQALWVLGRAGYLGDPRVQEAVELVASRRCPDGLERQWTLVEATRAVRIECGISRLGLVPAFPLPAEPAAMRCRRSPRWPRKRTEIATKGGLNKHTPGNLLGKLIRVGLVEWVRQYHAWSPNAVTYSITAAGRERLASQQWSDSTDLWDLSQMTCGGPGNYSD